MALLRDFAGRRRARTVRGRCRHPAPLIVLGARRACTCCSPSAWRTSGKRSRYCASGKYIGLRGPGLFTSFRSSIRLSRYVDQRVRVANVSAESTLTRDTVPVNVDAIVFWLVWNAEKSILEVQDFTQAISMSAQTALRESIGRHELHQMVAEREMLGKELQRILDEKTTALGHHRAIGGDSRRADSRAPCRTPCRARRRRSANGSARIILGRRRRRSPRSSGRPR